VGRLKNCEKEVGGTLLEQIVGEVRAWQGNCGDAEWSER